MKPDAPQASNAGDPLVTSSSTYQEFLAEREEILRHKWFRSEDAGRDVGFEEALVDWVVNHRSDWRKQRLDSKGTAGPAAKP